MVEDYEVDLHVIIAKKELLKSDTKYKTWIYFEDFVNAVHKFVNVAATPRGTLSCEFENATVFSFIAIFFDKTHKMKKNIIE